MKFSTYRKIGYHNELPNTHPQDATIFPCAEQMVSFLINELN